MSIAGTDLILVDWVKTGRSMYRGLERGWVKSFFGVRGWNLSAENQFSSRVSTVVRVRDQDRRPR